MAARNFALVLPLLVVLLIFVTIPAVDAWCPKMGQSCGPAYPCCECDPNNGGRKLYCDFQWGSGLVSGLVCGTYAFEPTCTYGASACTADGTCQYGTGNPLEAKVREALGLPRKLGMPGN